MKEKQIYFNVIRNYKRMASNLIANINAYESWSDDFCRKEITSLYSKLIKEFSDVDFTQFTADELKQLDFKWFDEDESLLCMPVWALDCLPDKCILTTIGGDEVIFDKLRGLDKDERFGSTAYGFTKSQLRDSVIGSILEK